MADQAVDLIRKELKLLKDDLASSGDAIERYEQKIRYEQEQRKELIEYIAQLEAAIDALLKINESLEKEESWKSGSPRERS